ncbi:uncharacterized protein F4812DRAFT_440582 [Daldinia caldariorum]|uniref:uncharacterized protein n=1 Tax=Daldinia caldariorum TaxID=326644 RepID=UPI0020089240|nr:uncharacterized protein F4812DRAFT_440582 [Daldinia caldariorum]KAI1464832.1 hypothetical protein F4812DRAFT_440582 [Daldinia caldariorum]
MQPWQASTTQYVQHQTEPRICQDNLMHDMRDAKNTVALFADYIDRLRPEIPRPHSTADLLGLSPSLVSRQESTSSADGSRRGSSKRHHRSVGKEWAGSPQGTLWNQISQTLQDVAAELPDANQTAIQEFISAPEILKLGNEFVHYYRQGSNAREKPYWAAEDLFFDLQSVKQGDVAADRWTRVRLEKRAGWDLADHLARFVLLADNFRSQANRQDWNTWGEGFVRQVSFYLCILRCFTIRDAEQQRQTARETTRDRDSKILTKRRSNNSGSSKVSGHSK